MMTEQLAQIDVKDLANGITEVKVSGRMDIKGTFAIEDGFAAVAEHKKDVVVDMSDVSFLASMGIRILVLNCKALAAKAGDLVLLRPQENVEKVLRSAGIDQVIKIYSSRDEAFAHFKK
jgi:anti-anti-sigma factor